jgi:hypothetical protein
MKIFNSSPLLLFSTISILSSLFFRSTWAQYRFESTYGGFNFDRATSIRTTSDGGYIITGSSSSFSSDQDPFLIKINKYSNVQWSKVYHHLGYEEKLHGVQQALSGDYYLAGTIEGGFGFLDDLIMKVDSVGNIIWSKVFGGIEADDLRDIAITPSGDILVAGQNASFGAGAKEIQAIKLTDGGDVKWAKAYGNIWEEFGAIIIQPDDGNYAFFGATDISGYYDIRPLLIKTDSLGNLIWAKIYSGYIEDWGRYAIKTQSGGFLIVGDTRSYGLGGSMDIYVIKTDSMGNVEWAKAYGGIEDESGRGAFQDNEGNYIITGFSNSFGLGGFDAFLMKITPNGDLNWFYTYGGSSNDYAFRMAQTSDSGYVMTGGNSSNSLGDEDLLLIKVDKFGSSTCQNGPFNPNIFTISNLEAVNYNLATSNVISINNFQLTTITPNTAQNFICGIVPVELKSFNYEIENADIVLNWSTATETNNMGFKILRDGEEIGFIAGAGTTTEPRQYSFKDESVKNATYEYTLMQMDYDGTINKIGELEVTVANIPKDYILEQNYPNPFNPSTKIRFAVPEKSYTTLRIYNSLGEFVEELVSEVKEAGNYEVRLNADNLISGIYFYRLSSGKFQETKKMLLLK